MRSIRRAVAISALLMPLVAPWAVAGASTSAAATTCTTNKIPVTKTVRVVETITVHGVVEHEVVTKKVDVRVNERERVKVRGKWDYVTKSVVKYKTVRICTPVAAPAPVVTTTTVTPVTTTTTAPSPVVVPSFNVTAIVGGGLNENTLSLVGTFVGINSVTVTDNGGNTSTCALSASNADIVDCGSFAPTALTLSQLTSITVSSPGLPIQTFSWAHLAPTVTAVDDGDLYGGTEDFVTYTVSGTFSGLEYYPLVIGKVNFGVALDNPAIAYASSSWNLTASNQAVSFTVEVIGGPGNDDESIAQAEANGVGLNWAGDSYSFSSNQGVPVDWVEPSTDTDLIHYTYDATTGVWADTTVGS
jgi:hypothetical protein